MHDGIDRRFDLVVRKFRVHGEAENFFGKLFSHWKCALARIAELLVGLGQVQRNRVMDAGSNSIIRKVVTEFISLRRPDYKQMEYMFAAGRYCWWGDR